MAKGDVKLVTPHAAVIIWNYRDRVGPNGPRFNLDSVEQKIISTISLIGIRTSKSKSTPAGNFELTLAPTKNWVNLITPGSWLCILMSQTKLEAVDFQRADPKKVKLLGRVDSVRVDVKVDQETGARQTVYSVVGSDWAQIFNTTLYIDPVARELPTADGRGTPDVGVANRWLYDKYVTDISTATNIPSGSTNVKALINLWGTTNSAFTAAKEIVANANVLVKPEVAFMLPKEVYNYFKFKNKSRKLVDLISYRFGVLNGYDNYQDKLEAVGIVKPDSILGTHTMWQVLNDNCNNLLNEMLCDMRWDSNGRPSLCLYKRIRPFCVRSTNEILSDGHSKGADFLKGLISRFENVKRVKIPVENVLSVNAGTNWRDKYNYVEIQGDKQILEDLRAVNVKINSSISNGPVYSREGFRPMIVPTKYFAPKADFSYDPDATVQWKYLLKEWYFDTHNMLNGTITFSGLDDYIQVGDNIIVDASVVGASNNTNIDNLRNKNNSYMLAHVESVNHSFSVNPDGARSYFTTVQFVRGIITNAEGKQFRIGKGRLDEDARAMNQVDEKNTVNVFSTSTSNDLDNSYDGN